MLSAAMPRIIPRAGGLRRPPAQAVLACSHSPQFNPEEFHVSILALWLPILVASVIVFVVSSILHMMLPFHRSDYARLQNEDDVMETMRKAGVQPATT
jgi:hypothetical protein